MNIKSINLNSINKISKNNNIFFFLENFLILCLKYVKKIYLYNNDKFVVIELTNNKYLINLFNILKKYFYFDILSDLVGLDFLKKKDNNDARFKLNYILTNIKYNIYIGIFVNTTSINSFNAEINSISNIWINANWLERENWDMLGIVFLNHKDLRRIFTDYGFNGFPLRKDFPLCGYIELRYDDEHKMLLYEPVEFSQEYRVFNFINPWDIYLNVK